MASLFTRIINGEIPCHKLCEDEDYLAFLEIRPINPGHALVVPKREVDYIFDIDDDVLGGMMVFSKKVAQAIKRGIDCKRIGVMVAGLEVPHAHIHLIPIQALGDLNFSHQKDADNKDLAQIAEKIRRYL